MSEVVVLNAKEAIARHVHWRIVLQFAITMEEQLTPEQLSMIQNHRECAIGRWLDSSVNRDVRQHPAYRELVAHHIEFHKEMIAISTLIAMQHFVEAGVRMKAQSSFGKASDALAQAITAFNYVSSIAVPL